MLVFVVGAPARRRLHLPLNTMSFILTENLPRSVHVVKLVPKALVFYFLMPGMTGAYNNGSPFASGHQTTRDEQARTVCRLERTAYQVFFLTSTGFKAEFVAAHRLNFFSFQCTFAVLIQLQQLQLRWTSLWFCCSGALLYAKEKPKKCGPCVRDQRKKKIVSLSFHCVGDVLLRDS